MIQFKIFISLLLFCLHLQAIDVLHSKKSHSLAYEMLEDARVYNSHVYSDHDFVFHLGFNYVQDPLVRKTQSNIKQVDSIVNNLSSLHLGASVFFTKNLMFGIQGYYGKFDYEYYQPGSPINSTKIKDDKSGFSDVILDLKWRFISNERDAFAINPFVRIPTGGGEIPIRIFNPKASTFTDVQHKVLSEDSYSFGLRFIYERYFNFMNLIFNLGYLQSDNAFLGELDLSKKLSLGIGAYVPLNQKIGFNIEWLRYFSLPFNQNQNPNELFLGVSAGLRKNIVGFVGGAIGNIFSNSDGNDYRLSAGVKFSPRVWSEEKKAIKLINKEVIVECKKPYVFQKSNKVIVRFPNNISAIYDSSELNQVVSRIKERMIDILRVNIVGHTSLSGPKEYNQQLSEKRAQTIKNYLIQQGVPEKIISSYGMGEELPLEKGNSNSAAEVNRRVEFLVTLKEKNGYYCERLDDYTVTPVNKMKNSSIILE